MEECMIVRQSNLENPPEKCHKCKKIFQKDERFYRFGKGKSMADYYCIECVNEASPVGQRIRPLTI